MPVLSSVREGKCIECSYAYTRLFVKTYGNSAQA